GQVKFILDSDSAKAVSGFLKVLEANDRVKSGLKQTHTHAKEVDSVFHQIHESGKEAFREVAMEAAATLTTFGGIKSLLAGIGENYSKIGEANIHFQQSLTPLLALGQTMQNMGRVKD